VINCSLVNAGKDIHFVSYCPALVVMNVLCCMKTLGQILSQICFTTPWAHVNLVPLFSPTLQYYMNIISLTVIEAQEQDPMTNFMYALKTPEIRRQWSLRLKIFLDFLQLEGSIEEQTRQFLPKARQNTY
jgi:hypothetical protein